MKFTTEQIRYAGGLKDALTARTQRLKEDLLNAEQTHSFEMADLTQTAYADHTAKPWPIQRAKALQYFFAQSTIYLRDGELLAGNRSDKLGAMPRIRDGAHPVSREFCENAPFPAGELEERWENRFLFEEYQALLPKQTREIEAELLAGLAPGSHEGFGHIIADYEYILKHGVSGLLQQIETRLKTLPQTAQKQRDFLQSVHIAWSGVAQWALRYAELAEQQAKSCNSARRTELLEIAQCCRKVPLHPAETFAEALQSFWFVHQAFTIEQKAGSLSVSGLDRYLNDYLLQDIELGRLTWAQADLLVESLMIKFMENAIWPVYVVQFANLSLGGMDDEGKDAANELSFLLLNAQMNVRSNTPMVSVRWHPNINPEFWLMAHRSIRMGSGLPALFSDEKMIGALLSWGVPKELAVDYGVVGCVEPSVKGETHGSTLGGHLNLAKCLELALNNGRTLISGRTLGPDTGNLTDFHSLEDLLGAYTAQVENAVRYDVEMVRAAAKAQRDRFGYPIMSATMHGCIERAKDMTEEVNYNYPTICILGSTDVVDSLLAVEHFVFKTQEVSTQELLEALRTNFETQENLRQKLVHHPRKFGNGNPEIAALYNRVCAIHRAAAGRYQGPRGDFFQCGVWPVELHVRFGKKTGALPSGRMQGAPLADGVGACHGMDRNGPTALLRDVAQIDAVRDWPGGYTFNIRLLRSIMETEEDLQKFASLTDTFFRLGGMQLQINTISPETLREAQQHPENYGELVVRVAGFSTYFVGLGKDVQDEIIARTTHSH